MRARSRKIPKVRRGFAFPSGPLTVAEAVQKRSDSSVREKSGAGSALD